MGVSFRKRVKIAPGINLNFSKSGVSTSVDPKGAKINVGKKGTYLNTSIPGTGIYSRQKISNNSSRKSPQQGCMVLLSLVLIISAISILSCCSGANKGMNDNKNLNESSSAVTTKSENMYLIPGFTPKYLKIKEEDISLKNEKRLLYRVSFPKGLSKDDIHNSFIYIVNEAKNKSPRNITIFAYYPDDNMDSSYTIGKFEFDAINNQTLESVISDSYFKEKDNLLKNGDIVILNTKEEYDYQTKKFISAKRTKISNNPKDFNDCDYVPNGTEVEIVDVFKERLTADYTWISYKVRITKSKKVVWVSDDCVTKKR